MVDERYRLVELLGHGGMGAVWRAHDQRLDRVVALKSARLPDKDQQERFVREARLCSRISHPNIVHVYDVGHACETVYYTMELVEGRDLAIVLEQQPSRIAGLVIVLLQIAGALHRVHREGIVHRDIKPSNVMLDESPRDSVDGAICKLVDFGLAADLRADCVAWSGPQPGRIMGTPPYMSPEQIRGEALDHRSDIYSFGCMMYEVLTGSPPFPTRDVLELLHQHSKTPPAPMQSAALDELPPSAVQDLERLVQHCLAKRPHDRPDSMGDVKRRLRAIELRPGIRRARS